MAWRRRVTSALAVFAFGSIAALPFYQPPAPVESSAVKSSTSTASQPPASVALQIPANDLDTNVVESEAKISVSSSPNASQPAVAKKSALERHVEPPIISNEFPKASHEVPQTITNPIKIGVNQNYRPHSSSENEQHGDVPRTHRIRDGDTLRTIAEKYLKNGDRWIEILDANRAVLRDPDVLPVGKVIKIPDRSDRNSSDAIAPQHTESKSQDQPLTPLVPIR